MYKAIPEIRVSSSTDNISENELLSDIYSDIATDCEILEQQSTPLLQTVKYDEELLTDVEGSNDEDSNTIVHPSYPIESLNRMFDIGMNCEEITNFKEPSKLLKTITLDKLKLNESHQDGYRTDIENFDDSDVDLKEIEYDCNISNDYLQTSNFTSIIDNVIIEKVTPIHTPELDSENKILTVQSKSLDCFTDTEMLLTDNENITSMKKCSTTNKSIRYLSDSYTSDSDENMQNKEKNKNIPKKLSGIRGNEMKSSAIKKATLLETKQQDINVTDIETIEIDNIRFKGNKRNPGKRQNIIQRSQMNSGKINNCQQMKSWKHCTDKKWQKIQCPTGHNCNRHNLKTALPEIGHLTDIEAFDEESDEEFVFDDIKPVSYIPESKSNLVLTSENDKGGVSLIMPIRDTSSFKYLQISSNNETGGHTDTEDLPGFEETYRKLCPTPDLQLDNTIVTNVEHMIDKSKLKIKLDVQDPHTDTEELDLPKNEASFSRLNIKDRKSPQLKVKECLTDVEDLSDLDTQHLQLATEELIERSGTDIDTLSDIEGDDDYNGYCTAITPEIKPMNSFTAAKEGIGLFPTETKQKLIEITPKIRTLSPSPTANDTDSEELLASMDEEQLLYDKYSTDEDDLETHMSVVHIKHTRKFPIEGAESLHIKDCDNQPDPMTDVEEIVAPLDDRGNKERNLPEDSSVSFNKSSEGISCKWYSERRYSCHRREERSTSGEKISHHKPVDVTKIQNTQEEEMIINNERQTKSLYDNIDQVYYTDLYDETVYPPQLGYNEIENETNFCVNSEIAGSVPSLVFDTGTDTFSELLFSSSNSETESFDDSIPTNKTTETTGILYNISEQINKVPYMFQNYGYMPLTSSSSPTNSLESRLKMYTEMCNDSVTAENTEDTVCLVSPENMELKTLEKSIDAMLDEIAKDEEYYRNYFRNRETELPQDQPNIINVQQEKPSTSLSEIEKQIEKLLKDVEHEEKQILNTIEKRNSGKNYWNMIPAKELNDNNNIDDNMNIYDVERSTYTPSPAESYSTSEDEYEIKPPPKVQLKVGHKFGKSTIDISLDNSPKMQRKHTKLQQKLSLNRSLPSLCSSTLTLPLREHYSFETIPNDTNYSMCQTSSVEYISPSPIFGTENSGYCIWAMPSDQDVINYGPVSTATITQSFIQEEGMKDEVIKQRKNEQPKKIVGLLEKLDTEEIEAPKTIKKEEIIKQTKIFKEIEKTDKNEALAQETIKKPEIKESIKKGDLKGTISPASAKQKQDVKEIIQKFDIEETLTKQEIKENIDKIDSKQTALPETVQEIKEIITKSVVKEAAAPETIKGIKVSVTENTITKEAAAPETNLPPNIKETIEKIDIKEVAAPEKIIPQKIEETIEKIDIKEVAAPEKIIPQKIEETIEKIDIKEVAAPETNLPPKIKETIERIDIKEVVAPEKIIPPKIKETTKKIDVKEVVAPEVIKKQEIIETIETIDIKEVAAPETIIPPKIEETIEKIDIKEVAAPEILKEQKNIKKIDKEALLPEAIKKKEIQGTVTSKIIEFIAAPDIRDKVIEESVTIEDDFKEAKITEPKPFDVEKDTKKEIRDRDRRQEFVEETVYNIHTDDVEKMVEEKEEEQYKPYVTTPTQSRRVSGIGGSQRLSREERPTVRIVTDFVEDSDTESESENYIVTEPVEKRTYPARKGVKFRFDSEDYREDKASDEEIVEEIEIEPLITEIEPLITEIIPEKKLSKTERRFERMASDTTVADTKESEGEFQRIISQMSTEEVNQALEQWDKGGMTPSEGDSKDTTTEGSSDHISPIMQEGSHSLEPEEHGETPPIPSPRTPIKPVPRESSKDTPPIPSQKTKQETTEKDTQKFASKKMFWEQMSTGSIDESMLRKEQEPPIPKPRMSIPTSSVLAEISKEISYSDTSRELEVSDIDEAESLKLQGTITTDDVAHGLTKERTLSQDGDTNSEVEYIATHELEDLSYDNPAFSQEECESLGEITVLPRTKKPIYERSASLPCDSSLDISSDNVRVKKRIFEAQIKKEMVVEQLMAQLEEESSPEHKSIGQQDELPATDTEAMVSRQIHSDIFSKELDEQIESLIPESKDIYQDKTIEKHELSRKISSEVSQESSQPLEEKSDEVSSESHSIYDPNLSSSVAEALQYKNDVISKPSDSLEVHVDKSEIEDTEKVKEIEEELRVMEEKEDTILQMPEEFDKVKVSSITSSQGESEDTFSESDVTPEDARYREQQDIQVYGPTEKESKLMPDKEDEQKKQRNVYTPEEHIPDTVWEVPVQEEIYSLQEETVQQLPLGSSISLDESEITEKIRKESITESEAREIAEIIVEDIETKLTETKLPKEEEESKDLEATDKQGQITKKIHDAAELDISKKSDTALRYIRTDTTTSSMEITDEDLRSSGVDTDVSPLESQAGCVYPMSVRSGEESSDDVDNQELEHDLAGKEDLDKTLAEVRQSLEAVKEELLEEKKKKKDNITKESPSEFEFKVLSLEKTFSESIQECHHEEVSSSALIKKKVDLQETSLKKEELSTSETTETTQTKFTEQIREEYSIEEKGESQKILEEKKTVKEEAISETSKQDLKSRQEFMSEKSMSEESQTISQSESITLSSKLSTSHEEKTEETTAHTTLEKSEYGEKEIIQEESDVSIDEVVEKVKVLSESTTTVLDTALQSEIQDSHEISETLRAEIIEEDGRIIETAETQETEIDRGDDRKSPTQDDVTSASDSSEKQGGSDSAPTFDKPNIIIRKHKKSSVSIRPADPKSDYELYSSSGESHYHSFEQTSESIRTPGSRPLSSDIEGLVPHLAGVTGSSEYESAISGQSTTMTSKDFHTAVSSLSSRDSMKSLDSESSGNLASVEISSEASETLVPSAMELEKDMEPTGAVEPVDKPVLTKTELRPKAQSFSESNDQSVSFDISAEDMSEDEEAQIEQAPGDMSQRMKRSHEMTFQPEPRPISEEVFPTISQEEKYASSLDDMTSLVSTSDTGEIRTVIEVSRTESDRMDGSATSEQLSLTVSGTSELLSLSDVKDIDDTTVINKVETTATQSPSVLQQSTIESVTITTSSVLEQGIQSVCTQVTSKVSSSLSHSNGPTQVEYNAEYDEGEPEVKKKGHRRNGSTSFRPSMVPVFYGKDLEKKKSEEITEDSAESDKYTESLTLKEGSQEEKKDVDEAERLEDEFYQTEADQGLHRDIREGRVILEDTYGLEELKDLDFAGKISKSRLSSAAFSDDHPDSELAELLKQCSTEVPSEDPIERPKTPEPVEECEIKDDTPEFSSEAQASVTELEMEYSGAFSRTSEYEAHISPIREKELLPQDLWEQTGIEQEDELAEAEAAFQTVSSQMLSSLPQSMLEESIAEKHELETQEIGLKEESVDRSKLGSSPVPDITITQHMVSQDDSFEYPDDLEAVDKQETIISVSSKASSECETDQGQEYVLDGYGGSSSQDQVRTQISPTTEEKKEEEKDDIKEHDSNSESPTSDSFELLEKPDIADEFVIIEEVGREAQEQDSEGKGLKIGARRVSPRSHTVVQKEEIVSPPSTATKMTKLKYFGSGGTEEEIPFDFESGSPSKVEEKTEESSQEGSPPSAEEQDEFKPEVEAGKKWMEMQFQGEPIAQIYGYEIEYERGGPLEDIKEEDINDLESSSKIGSMGSQVSHSIGSFGSVKESLSSTPDYDVLAGRRFFTRSGEHDDVSMSSLQEFERLENLIALESTKHRSLGSQDSLTSSSNSRKHGSRSGGDDISLASLKEFEGLESACIAAERIEKKAKAEEESLLSEIEEGHESQASESESCVTVSVGAINRGESDEDDYEKRMFEIDEIIRQAQTNVESFMDAKSKELLEEAAKRESLARADSLEEISKVPDLDFDQPLYSVSYSSGKSYIQQWSDLGEDLLTSTDSLEMKTQISKMSVDPFTTSTDSLEVKMSQDVMSVSTDSIEASQKIKKKDVMTDSIEVGEKSSMITSTDSLEGKVTQANSLDEEEQHIAGTHDQSSSSGKDGDLSSSGREDSAGEGAIGMLTNRMPPPRAEFLLGSTDSLEPTSSTATHATYQYETDSVMSSSFTSGDSATMVDDNDEEAGARAAVWFDEGKPYVTEVIEPTIGDDDFSHMIHRTVEMPPEIHKVTFKGKEAEQALRQYIERFDPGEDISETREEDDDGNVHVKRVIQRRVIIRPEEMGGDTTDLTGPELEKYLKSLTDTKMGSVSPLLESVQISSTSMDSQTTTSTTSTTITTKQWTSSQGETIKTEQPTKEPQESRHRGKRPPLKYDISVDEEPEFDPREHDWRFNLQTHLEGEEEQQEMASGYSDQKSGSIKPSSQEKKK